MTVREMQIKFEQKITFFSTIDLKIDSIDVESYLNWSQDNYIRRVMREEEAVKRVYEHLQKRMGNLRTLIKTADPTGPVAEVTDALAFNHVQSFQTPADYLFYVKGLLQVTRSEETDWVEGELIEFTEIDHWITNMFNKPYIRKPKIVLKEGDFINVIHDYETDVLLLQLVYIREPKDLSITTDNDDYTTVCELDENTHMDIVDLAVEEYLRRQNDKAGLLQMQATEQTIPNSPESIPN